MQASRVEIFIAWRPTNHHPKPENRRQASHVSTRSRATVLVGTRSRVIRLNTSDGHMRCTASDGGKCILRRVRRRMS